MDQPVTYHFPKQTPLTEVLAELSQQTGISLSTSPELPPYTFASYQLTESLRAAMKRLGSNLIWIREANGYKLVPNVDEK